MKNECHDIYLLVITLHYIILFGGSQFNYEIVAYDFVQNVMVDIMQKKCRMMDVGSRFLSKRVHIWGRQYFDFLKQCRRVAYWSSLTKCETCDTLKML